MILTILVAFIGLMGLLVIHEFGHFILAKCFRIRVDEFGVGYPPRIFGRKFGETIYSLNLIPFGAFVKVYGEEGGTIEDYRSFIGKPMWKRILVVLGGVASFWVMAAIILSIVAGVWGLPLAVEDQEELGLSDPRVQIIEISSNSPAKEAGLKVGDTIVGFEKIGAVQKFIGDHKGGEITLVIKRGKEVFEKKIIPRISHSEDEGPIGIGLTRIALKKYPWYQAPSQGVIVSGKLTATIVEGWALGLKSLLGVTKLPEGVEMELMGPLGIFDLLREYSELGINYFLFLVALISVALALSNILPIPALDGGKLIFLIIEAIKGSPVNQKLEQKITSVSFALLILLMIFVTVKFDIPRVF